jgi:integrase
VHLRALLFYAAPLNDARKTISGNCFGVFISLKAPGLYSDGGNLGLQVMPGGSRSWIFQYDRAGKRVKLGLGPLHTISLEEAREKARELRAQLLRGEVPANARTAQRSSVSFRKVAAEFLAVHRDGWRSQQGAVNFERSLAQHIMPVLGDLAVDKIEVEDVFRVLSPIWHRKISTAALLRARIEQILDFARACRYRSGENPAVWKGNLAHRLPSKSKLHRPEPQPALPYQQLPEFMQHLRGVPGIPALALQFLILTATRTGDLIGGDRQNPRPMLWAHVDVADALWVIPRGKNNQRHQVPLSAPVLRILEQLKLARDPASDIVFTGDKPGTIMAIGAFALSLCRNGDQADDLVQDTLLKAWTNLASFEPGTNMLAWLCTILRNRFYSDCRSRRRALEPIDDFAEQIRHEADANGAGGARGALRRIGAAAGPPTRGADFGWDRRIFLRGDGEKMRMSGGHHQEQGQSRASGAR